MRWYVAVPLLFAVVDGNYPGMPNSNAAWPAPPQHQPQQHQPPAALQVFGQQQSPPPPPPSHTLVQQGGHISFREIDDMDRETVLQYVLDTLRKAVAENDPLRRRPGQSQTRLATDEKMFYDDLDARAVAQPLGDEAAAAAAAAAAAEASSRVSGGGGGAGGTLQGLFERLSSPSFRIRNLTVVIALSYMDKVANILHLYATSRTVRRLFGGCLIIASKMHQNEVSREELADAMGLSLGDLVRRLALRWLRFLAVARASAHTTPRLALRVVPGEHRVGHRALGPGPHRAPAGRLAGPEPKVSSTLI